MTTCIKGATTLYPIRELRLPDPVGQNVITQFKTQYP